MLKLIFYEYVKKVNIIEFKISNQKIIYFFKNKSFINIKSLRVKTELGVYLFDFKIFILSFVKIEQFSKKKIWSKIKI